jgi:hypothetical protein
MVCGEIHRLTAEAESLNDKFGKEGVKVESGEGGLPKVSLSSPNGRYFSILSLPSIHLAFLSWF